VLGAGLRGGEARGTSLLGTDVFGAGALSADAAAELLRTFGLLGGDGSADGALPDRLAPVLALLESLPPEIAEPLYEYFCTALRELGVHVETGVFGARMAVELVNDGPVTIVLDT